MDKKLLEKLLEKLINTLSPKLIHFIIIISGFLCFINIIRLPTDENIQFILKIIFIVSFIYIFTHYISKLFYGIKVIVKKFFEILKYIIKKIKIYYIEKKFVDEYTKDIEHKIKELNSDEKKVLDLFNKKRNDILNNEENNALKSLEKKNIIEYTDDWKNSIKLGYRVAENLSFTVSETVVYIADIVPPNISSGGGTLSSR